MDFEMLESYQGANVFDTDYFIKLQPMTGEEIAEELETTRQNVSRILKDVMEKFYNKVKRLNRELSPFEVATCMLEMLGINQREEAEISKFFSLFPPVLRNEIEEDGKRILAKYRKHRR